MQCSAVIVGPLSPGFMVQTVVAPVRNHVSCVQGCSGKGLLIERAQGEHGLTGSVVARQVAFGKLGSQEDLRLGACPSRSGCLDVARGLLWEAESSC